MKKLKQKTYNLLRWSEKYFKTDMVYLAKGGSWLTLGQVISSLSAFLLAIAFANLLPKEVYGNYKYILSIVGIITAFSLTGMGTAIVQAVARGFEGSLKHGFWTSLKWSIGMVIISLIGAIYYFINDNYTLAISLLIAGSFSPFLNSFALYGPFLNGKKDFKTMTIYGVFRNIIPALSIFITLFITQNPIFLVLIYFISNTITVTYLYFITLNKHKINNKKELETINYGKHLSLMNVLSIVAMQIDKVLIFHYLGAAELAIYIFAIIMPEQIKHLLKNISPLALPKFSQKTSKEIKKTVLQKMFKMGLVIIIITILYISLSPFIYKIFFPQYIESIFYSQIFAISLITTVLFVPITALQAKKQTKILYSFNIISSIYQILSIFILIYYFGLLGAIIARIIIRFINLFYSLFLLKKI